MIAMMSQNKSQFSNADAWRDAAMARPTTISDEESARRSAQADAHNRDHNISDADVLDDQQLYIQGKMELEEYQDYLLLKHGRAD